MADDHPLESTHERRITWGLMAIVVAFVLLMTGIVLWITASLIRNELGGSSPTVSPSPLATDAPALFNSTSTAMPEATKAPTQVNATEASIPVDSASTSAPRLKRYVKFVYWYVTPGSISLGDCVQVVWETENAVSLKLYRNGELILDNAPASLAFKDCPTKLGYNIYRMVSVNKAGESNWIQGQVRVQEARKKPF